MNIANLKPLSIERIKKASDSERKLWIEQLYTVLSFLNVETDIIHPNVVMDELFLKDDKDLVLDGIFATIVREMSLYHEVSRLIDTAYKYQVLY
jgi:hypothetical protein